MKRKIINLISAFLFGVVLGMLIFRNNWFPISLYRTTFYKVSLPIVSPSSNFGYPYGVFFTPYTVGVPLFSDRPYHDSLGNKELENSHIIQISRHYTGNLKIEVDNKVIIYRVLSKKNDNSFFKDWESTNIKVNVKGTTCSHTFVVKKTFDKGIIILKNSKNIASSPIIIKNVSDISFTSLKINDVIIDNKYGLTNCLPNTN